jgi:hypothetical protein
MVQIMQEDPKQFIRGGIVDFAKYADIPFIAGVRINARRFLDARIECQDRPKDFFRLGSQLIASRILVDIVVEHGANVQCITLPIIYRKKVLEDYYFLNILDVVDCVDWKRTEIVGERQSIPTIRRLALETDQADGIAMFRIFDTALIGVSGSLASRIISAKCSGVIFTTPKEWRNIALFER